MGNAQMSVVLKERQKDLLRKLAAKHGISQSAVISQAITRWAEQEGLT